MYRFLAKPKWIAFTVLCVAAVVAMVNLGFWQLRRLDERRTFNSLVESRMDVTPVPMSDLAALAPADREYRVVTLTGTYTGGTEQVPTAGGYLLVTPFGVDGGQTVYVDRGYVGSAAAVPVAPTGSIQLTARFRRTPTAAESVPAGGVFLDRVASLPDEATVAPRELPTLDEGPHLSYTIQWFIFSVCVAVGWVLAVRRSARARLEGPATPDLAAEAQFGPSGEAVAPAKPAVRKRSKHQAVPWQDEPARSAPSPGAPPGP